MEKRLHFWRQSIHAHLHSAPEVLHTGSGVCSSQWPMERTTGKLVEEMRQPSNPYANISEKGLQRAQITALMAMIPALVPRSKIPRVSKDLGDGYLLLGPKNKYAQAMSVVETVTIHEYYISHNTRLLTANPQIIEWGRVRLSNQQIVRTAWKEKVKDVNKIRMSRNIVVSQYCLITL